MLIEVLKSKIHRIKVTDGNLNYIGSLTLDLDFMDNVGLIHGEKIQVLNVENGERLETYVIQGERGKGEVIKNGPATFKIKYTSYSYYITFLEPMTRIELVTSSLPRKRSTPELHRHFRAGDEGRTRDIQLGRLTLYQLSYSRLLYYSVGRAGFEPAKVKPTDLQSVLVGRLSISPTIPSRWRDSNPRPADYKSAALAN